MTLDQAFRVRVRQRAAPIFSYSPLRVEQKENGLRKSWGETGRDRPLASSQLFPQFARVLTFSLLS